MMFRWLRKFVRRRTSHIAEDKAEVWQKRFSLLYMVAGWNALALVGYLYYNRDSLGIKVDLKETTAERMVRLNQVPKATVYKFENLSFKGKKDLKNESHQRSSIDTEKID